MAKEHETGNGKIVARYTASIARRIHAARLFATALLFIGVVLASVLCSGAAAAPNTARLSSQVAPPRIIPAPVSLRRISGSTFALQRSSRIVVAAKASKALPVARYFASILHRSTGYPLSISRGSAKSSRHDIAFYLSGPASLGKEGYQLDVTKTSVRLGARTPEGLFRGVQTLRQLFPAKVESSKRQSGPWQLPGVQIVDHPRFSWRGVHLDVARHFFSVADVKRLIGLLSLYKVNVLHLHLSDDQGWRIQIDSWPNLTTIGGSTEVGGGPGGYYTKDDYSAIVSYAASRYMTVVPEIDSPGHTNAALASYPELNCNGVAPPLYTGWDVGFSSLCISKEVTYNFMDNVVSEISALTPGAYFHIGGDEAQSTTPTDYASFVNQAQQIVQGHGKKMIGWVPGIEAATLVSGSVGEYWAPGADSTTWEGTGSARAAVAKGVKLILAPANRSFLAIKYNPQTRLGFNWSGYIEAKDSYQWDPGSYISGISAGDVLGLEACLWSETFETMEDIEYMTFPRLPALTERGWSPAKGRSWSEFRLRLAAQAPRWRVMGIKYYRSPQVSWK